MNSDVPEVPDTTWNYMTRKDFPQTCHSSGVRMIFPGMLDLTLNLCSCGWNLHISSPSKCPKLWVTGPAQTRLTNHCSALKVVLQPLMNLSMHTLKAKCDFCIKEKQFVGALVQIKPEKEQKKIPQFLKSNSLEDFSLNQAIIW